MKTLKIQTDLGEWQYDVDNSGKSDVGELLQGIFDEIRANGSRLATIRFAPGVYYINRPLTLTFLSLKIEGEAHGGPDIHGMNTRSGTTLMFGKDCGPACITLCRSEDHAAFPSGEIPWSYESGRVRITGINFVGYNNTDVDTQRGYSRMRGDKPNFRGLKWYPMPDRYNDIEAEGQRAIVLPASSGGRKNEMLSIDHCYFTDLYIGVDVMDCDVSEIGSSWFGQMVYGIRYHNAGQSLDIHDNVFADLECAVELRNPTQSVIHHNSMAYISKGFILRGANIVELSDNVLNNWSSATGTVPCGAFLHASDSRDIIVKGNCVRQELDSRFASKIPTEDNEPTSFIHFKNCQNLNFYGNLFNTVQTEPVVCFEDCSGEILCECNLITHAEGGEKYCYIPADSHEA